MKSFLFLTLDLVSLACLPMCSYFQFSCLVFCPFNTYATFQVCVCSVGSVFLPLTASKVDFNSSVALCFFYFFFHCNLIPVVFSFRLFSLYGYLFLCQREFVFCHAIKIANPFISIKYQISNIF